ncbi:MAG: D,D-heptose 1,7-bisphosphate phosphatase [Litorilinea sp.]|nr:MAG: D,D-heptose 1,7-bisphosphate phosphatase [Litorilinea sp.]
MADRQAVFLDRDGTLIHDVGYPRDPAEVELLPGVVQALHLLHKRGMALVVISNQSGIGRGLLTDDDLTRVHNRLVQVLAQHGVKLDGAYYCPHAPWERCACRKPHPGLLHRAAEELDLDLADSFMVGDKWSDVAAGHQAGCRTVLLRNRANPMETPPRKLDRTSDMIVPDLLAATYWILSQVHANEGSKEDKRVN